MTTDVPGAGDEHHGVDLEVGITAQDPTVTDETTATPFAEDGKDAGTVTTPSKGGKPIKPDNWMNP